MTVTFWIIVGGLGGIAGFVLGSWISDAVGRAQWRKAAIYLWTRHPMNTTPPTTTELRQPEWIQPSP